MRIETFSILAGSKKCDAQCPFCISRMTGLLEAPSKEPDVNWRNFHKSARFAQINGASTVLITGKGEPTLFPDQITQYLEALTHHDFPIIELQTNALFFRPKQFSIMEKHLLDWYRLGLNTIAISIAHYDYDFNKSIYTPKSSYIDLGQSIHDLHRIGFSVRLSCVLIKGGIDSPAKASDLIKFAKSYNVEQLTLRELRKEKYPEDKSVQEYCEKNAIDWAKERLSIAAWLKTHGRHLMTLPHGAKVYDVDKQNVCITDCEMIHPESDDIRTLIFFPEGHLRYNWEYGGAIIF